MSQLFAEHFFFGNDNMYQMCHTTSVIKLTSVLKHFLSLSQQNQLVSEGKSSEKHAAFSLKVERIIACKKVLKLYCMSQLYLNILKLLFNSLY